MLLWLKRHEVHCMSQAFSCSNAVEDFAFFNIYDVLKMQ